MLQPSIYGCELDNFPIFCREQAFVGQGARQLTGDEGSYLPKGKLLCLWKYKTIRQCMKGNNQIWMAIGQIRAFISFN